MSRARVFAPRFALAQWLAITVSGAAFALEPITYSGREALTSGSAWSEADSTADKCAKLARDMEDLKGKPLRRSAAADRYAAECTNEPPTPAPQGPLP